MSRNGRYGDLRMGLCPHCLKDINDCCEDNGGFGKCSSKKQNSKMHCQFCFEPINICKCKYGIENRKIKK